MPKFKITIPKSLLRYMKEELEYQKLPENTPDAEILDRYLDYIHMHTQWDENEEEISVEVVP